MGVFDQGYEQALIDAGRQPVERPPAGFLDTFLATWESTRQEDLSISESTNLGRHRQTRREKIKELTGEDISFLEGEALPQIWMGQETDPVKKYRAKIRELSARHPEIRTDEDILTDISEESRRIRERTEKVLGNTTFGGKLGSFAGAMAAATTDPLVLASMAFGASASATVLRTALTEAGIGALSEAIIQPFVWRYKKKLESPYDLGEALTRVAGAGVGSAALAGTIKGAARAIGKLRKPKMEGLDDLLQAHEQMVFTRQARGIEPTTAERDAAHVLGDYGDTLRENPFELGDPAADMRHLEATAKAIADVEAGRPVDVQEFVRGVEPREELRGEPIVRRDVRSVARDVIRGHLFQPDVGLSAAEEVEYAFRPGELSGKETQNLIEFLERVGTTEDQYTLRDLKSLDPSEFAKYERQVDRIAEKGIDLVFGKELRRLPPSGGEELRGEPAFVTGEGVTPKRGPGIEEPTGAKPLEPEGGIKYFDAYQQARDDALATYNEAIRPAKEQYEKAIAPHAERQQKHIESAENTYRDVLKTAERRLQKALNDAEDQFNKSHQRAGYARSVDDYGKQATTAEETYRKTKQVAEDQYTRDTRGAEEAFLNAKSAAERKYNTTIEPLKKAYAEARLPAEKVYREALAPIEKAIAEGKPIPSRPSPSGPPQGGGLAPSPSTRAITDPTFERLGTTKEAEVLTELEARAKTILDVEDVEISMVARAEEGELVPLTGREAAEAFEKGEGTLVQRSAREFIQETEQDAKMGGVLRDCLIKG